MEKRMLNVDLSSLMKGVVVGMVLVLPARAANLSGTPGQRGIIVGTAIQLNARTAPETIGKRGIIVGTCRQLKGGPLTLQGRNGRHYQLADGVYESKQGIQIHIRRGAVARIGFSRGGK